VTPTVVIAGAGFGGLRAAKALARAPVHVVLVDRNNYHLFQPLLYQVAMAGLEPSSIARPVRRILRGQKNFEFRMADVTGVDRTGRVVHTSAGSVPYDYLILAVGGRTNYFGIDSVARNALGLKGLADAVAIRNHVLSCFEQAVLEPDLERRRMLLTFLVVGGGPTGVEMAGALAELIRLVLSRDTTALNMQDTRILLLEAGQRLLAGMRPRFSHITAEMLWKKHVEVRFGTSVEAFDGARARIAGGEVIPTRTLVWAAGVEAVPLAPMLGVKPLRQGRVAVDPALHLPGDDRVFVIGDAAYLESGGQALPMLAPVAIQMANSAATNIRRQLAGGQARPFTYRDPGSLATIGRNAAVADIRGIAFQGFPAWVVWLVVHIIQLIGFRNKLFVLLDWAWDYFFYDRSARLITRD
jgi:NADH dehydrogenase